MKSILCILFIFSGHFIVSAQTVNSGPEFQVIYIDNSRPSVNDGFSEGMAALLKENIEKLSDTSVHFLVYLSDKQNFTVYTSTSELKKVLDRVYSGQTQFPDKQAYDIARIKDELSTRMSEMGGKLVFNYYVSEKFVKLATDRPPYLLKFLPQELAAEIGDKVPVEVNVFYPLANKVVNPIETQNTIKFYLSEHAPNIKYTLQSF